MREEKNQYESDREALQHDHKHFEEVLVNSISGTLSTSRIIFDKNVHHLPPCQLPLSLNAPAFVIKKTTWM